MLLCTVGTSEGWATEAFSMGCPGFPGHPTTCACCSWALRGRSPPSRRLGWQQVRCSVCRALCACQAWARLTQRLALEGNRLRGIPATGVCPQGAMGAALCVRSQGSCSLCEAAQSLGPARPCCRSGRSFPGTGALCLSAVAGESCLGAAPAWVA